MNIFLIPLGTIRAEYFLSLGIFYLKSFSYFIPIFIDIIPKIAYSTKWNSIEGGKTMYCSVKETSEKWNISDRRVRILCEQGKIAGAIRVGKLWKIPSTAQKPKDQRQKQNTYHSVPAETRCLSKHEFQKINGTNGKTIRYFDTTLRDGSQAEGVSFSIQDKMKIVKLLDDFGVDYIEAGNPGSNPKESHFFDELKHIQLHHAKLCAFGSTTRNINNIHTDRNVRAALDAGTPVVSIVGKTSPTHVKSVLRISKEENETMIRKTLSYLKQNGKEVIFDAEHFFDGYKEDAAFALDALRAAVEGGANILCLCDTNGGTLPTEIQEITLRVKAEFPQIELGIHCHNDIGCAVAATMMAVDAGVTHVQGTYLGFGERCGNTPLSTVIGNLTLKCGYSCSANLSEMLTTGRLISSISSVRMQHSTPYIGKCAFAHKGGMHIDGIQKLSGSFEHIDPSLVGNERRFLMSEVGGRSAILPLLQKLDPALTKKSPETIALIDIIKAKEFIGYQYEGADASLELLVRRHLHQWEPHFNVILYKTTEDMPAPDGIHMSSAMVKIEVNGKTEMACGMGIGPLHALDTAMREALITFYPGLSHLRMSDYKVRVLETNRDTDATTRVLMETTDENNQSYMTEGVSTDIVESSFLALVDAYEYKLSKLEERK